MTRMSTSSPASQFQAAHAATGTAVAKTGGPLARLNRLVRRGFVQFDPNDPNAPTYRARMLNTVTAMAPISVPMNLLATGLVGWLFRDRLQTWQIAAWVVATLVLTAMQLSGWLRERRQAPRAGASQRALRMQILRGIFLGLMWGLMLWRVYPEHNGAEGQILVAIVAGVMCAGGYIMAAIPAAGISFVVVLASFSAATFGASGEPLALLLAGLTVLFAATICTSIGRLSHTFLARLIAENEAARQQQVVGLLLKDFEDHASDVLWEIDARGRIRHASSKLLVAFGIEPGKIPDRSFLTLLSRLRDQDVEDDRSLKRLRRRFSAGVPFSNEAIRLKIRGDTRWWGITAKPLSNEENGRISGWRGVISDITESKTSHSALYKLAHRCPLTGLANRRHFMAKIAETLDNLPQHASCAILYLDLDNFKKVNDVHGHAMGDALLKSIGRTIGSGLRKGDLAARLGGDEFAILLARIESEEIAAAFAGRLLTRVEPAFRIGDLQMPVGMSIGIAVGPKHGTAPDELMRAADLALYRAKSTGKGSVQIYSPVLGREKHRRRILEEALRTAVRKEQLTIAYQPQVAIATGEIVAFEALVRWQHPELGSIAPSEFVPIAEETGLIEELGAWVLRVSCRHATRWPSTIGLAVNVSPVQAMGENLAASVRRAIAESGLQIKRLEVEITESIFLNEDSKALQNLHALRAMGVKIALDDFGVGYSSLGYLRRFPFNSLKIDRAFTGELATSLQARSIVKAIVTLANSLEMTTIVEGVEYQAQLAVVRETGCDHFQGFLCSSAIAPDAIPTLLRDWSQRFNREQQQQRLRRERQAVAIGLSPTPAAAAASAATSSTAAAASRPAARPAVRTAAASLAATGSAAAGSSRHAALEGGQRSQDRRASSANVRIDLPQRQSASSRGEEPRPAQGGSRNSDAAPSRPTLIGDV